MPTNILGQLKELNSRLTLNQKLSIGALATVILCSLLSFVYLIRQEPYQLLFSDLEAEGAQTIVEKLKEQNIDYEISNGGRSVSVPAGRIDQARMIVATAGLPNKGRMGFEIFDQSNWGVTKFVEEVNYRRALEGELERTIGSLTEVARARVHLVLEKKALFQEDQEAAKASVVIDLAGGADLLPAQIKGITNLVASSVESLKPSNVTIVDKNGNLLSHQMADEMIDLTLVDVRRKMERDLSTKVTSILEPLVGMGKVRVTASVLLDNKDMQQTEELVDPERTALVRQRRTDQKLTANQVGGIPFKANDQTTDPETGENIQNLLQEEVHYDVSKTTRNTTLPRGSIQQISVAVVVDDKMTRTPGADGQAVEEVQRRSEEEMKRLESLVAATIGFDAERGDVLTVENISFSIEPEILPEPDFLQKYLPQITPLVKYLRIFLLFLLFYLLVFRPVKKRVFAYVEANTEYGQLQAATQDREMVTQLKGRMEKLGDDSRLMLVGDDGEEQSTDKKGMTRQLVALAKKDPEMVTKLVKTWLAEEGV